MTATPRSLAPVFVVGCPRSGTTLVAHLLASSGVFANYRAETHFFDQIVPRFGPLERLENRERLLALWIESEYARRSGLAREEIKDVFLSASSAGQLISRLLGRIAEHHGTSRWVDSTPAHGLHMARIRLEVPDALFVHIVRDGRDVALSLDRVGWVRPLPWDRNRRTLVAGWTWEWTVRRIQASGRQQGSRYLEVRFDRLLREPRFVVEELSDFLDARLDLDTMLANPVGSLASANSAFGDVKGALDPAAIGRWRAKLDPRDADALHATIGQCLRQFGFDVPSHRSASLREWAGHAVFRSVRTLRAGLKSAGPLSRRFTRTNLEDSGGPTAAHPLT